MTSLGNQKQEQVATVRALIYPWFLKQSAETQRKFIEAAAARVAYDSIPSERAEWVRMLENENLIRAEPPLLTFQFDILPPNANAYARMHWRVRGELRDQWIYLIKSQLNEQVRSGTPPNLGEALVIAKMLVNRRRDEDNLHAMMKLPLDALRHAGVIVNDSPRHIKLHVTQELAKKRPESLTIEVYRA